MEKKVEGQKKRSFSQEHRENLSKVRVGKYTGDKNPNWKGGTINFNGRKLIFSPNHPYPNFDGKYVFRYRLVMEKKLGRFLYPQEIVHHKNGIIDDDREDNLEVLTQSEHAKLEYYTKRKIDKKTGRFI